MQHGYGVAYVLLEFCFEFACRVQCFKYFQFQGKSEPHDMTYMASMNLSA